MIFCRIESPIGKPFLLHLSYTPNSSSTSSAGSNSQETIKKEFHFDYFPPSIEQITTETGWSIHFPDFGSISFNSALEEVQFSVETKEISLECKITGRERWNERDGRDGPEGGLAHLDHLIGQHWVRSRLD